jgi:hypothetical protein
MKAPSEAALWRATERVVRLHGADAGPYRSAGTQIGEIGSAPFPPWVRTLPNVRFPPLPIVRSSSRRRSDERLERSMSVLGWRCQAE